jgi:pimeloyl-ACP methyl ester carboxylesterase
MTMQRSTQLGVFEEHRLALLARYGFEGESRWVVDHDGRRTYTIVRGEVPRPTVLVHGGLSHAGEWYSLAGRLPGHVVIPDRPGCGLSYPIDYLGVDYRRAAADWLLDLVNGIGSDQVDLVGNSMGGFFCIAFAVAHPERVRRLVLVGAPAGLDRTLPFFVRLMGTPIVGPLLLKMKITDPEQFRTRIYAPLLVANPEQVPVDVLELDIEAGGLPGVDRAAYTMLRSIGTLGGFRPRLMLRDDLAQLPIPTKFIWGDSDAFAPASSGQGMVARMTNATIEVVPGAGHTPWIDRPDTVADSIIDFLGSDGLD